jgi:hypothetical protein
MIQTISFFCKKERKKCRKSNLILIFLLRYSFFAWTEEAAWTLPGSIHQRRVAGPTSTLQVSIFNGEWKREKTEHSFVRVTTQNREVTHKEINQKNEKKEMHRQIKMLSSVYFVMECFLMYNAFH